MSKVELTINGIIGEKSEMDARFDAQLEGTGVNAEPREYFSAQNMTDFLDEPDTKSAQEIEIVINSPGGDVQHGLAIYDMLEREKTRGATITTIGYQFDSIASVIMLAGDKRIALKGARPLIHNAWMSPADLDPSIKLNTQTLQLIEKDFEVSDAQILAEYVRKLGREKAYLIKAVMNDDRELSDAEVLELGFAQELIDGRPKKAIKALAFNSRLMAQFTTRQYSDVIGFIGGKILMVQRALTDDFEPGKWAFPGGKVEENESPADAAARELEEETGYTATNIRFVEAIQNEDGTLSNYFAADLTGQPKIDAEEVGTMKLISPDEVGTLDLIKGQTERFNNLINKSTEMADQKELKDRLAAMEKRQKESEGLFAKVKALFTGGQAKAMELPLEGGETLFVEAGEGQPLEGSIAVLSDGSPAPAGEHSLSDGRKVVIGEGGVIESVADAASETPSEEEMQAAIDAAVAKAMEEKDKEIVAMKAEKDELAKAFKGLEANFKAMNAELKALKEEVPGDNGKETPEKKHAAMKLPEGKKWEELSPSEQIRFNAMSALRKN